MWHLTDATLPAEAEHGISQDHIEEDIKGKEAAMICTFYVENEDIIARILEIVHKEIPITCTFTKKYLILITIFYKHDLALSSPIL